MQNTAQNAAHTLTLHNRASATITGVEDVECFNEQLVVLRTPLGALTLSGEGLNISQLNLEEGKLIVEGEIGAMEYAQRKKTAGAGFLGRLFS